jgi:tetratricopeptide (TPR) repeat protein
MHTRTSHWWWLLLGGLLLAVAGCGPETNDGLRNFTAAMDKAQACIDAGRETEARAVLLGAADMPVTRGMRRGDARLLLGDVYREAALFDSARMMYEQAVEEYRSQADRRSAYNATFALAGMLRQLGADREAFELCTESLRLARVFKDTREELATQETLLPLAIALRLEEDEDQLATRLLKIARDSAWTTLEARVLLETGTGKHLRNDDKGAVQDFLRAVSVAEQGGDSLATATVLLRLAEAFDAAGRAKEAIDTYTTAVQRLNTMSGALPLRLETLMRIGNHYLAVHNLAEADRFYSSALGLADELGNRVVSGYVLVQLGHCLLPHARDKATARYQEALQHFRSVSFGRGVAFANHALARASEAGGRLTDAVDFYKKAIAETDALHRPSDGPDVFEECEQQLAGGRSLSAYDNLIALLLQVGKEDDAFWYLERKNARGIFNALSAMELQTANANSNRMLFDLVHARALCIGAERQLQRVLETRPLHTSLIAEVNQSFQKAHREFAAHYDRLIATMPQLAPALQCDGLPPSTVQARLGADEALVAYTLTPRSTYAFFITRSRMGVHLGVGGNDRLLETYHELLDDLGQHIARVDSGDIDRYMPTAHLQELSRSLYESMILPMEPALRGVSQLRVILPSEMSSLPLHALQRRGGQFLAERMLVSYLPTARWALQPPAKTPSVAAVVGLGHAGSTSWDVEYELRDIRAFYKDAQLFFGKQATLSMLQGTHADVLHLALEVEMSHQAPGTSYLLLSDGQSAASTSRIPAGRILSWAPAGTVVLSNLAASMAPVHGALPSLFFVNGTPLVMTNGIPAARKAKKVFGEMYYTGLASGLPGPAAFRRAQQEMIRDKRYAAPQFWAPFMLWGR